MIHEAVEASRKAGDLKINEDIGHLRVTGHLNHAALKAWQAVSDTQEQWLSVKCRDVSNDLIDPRDSDNGDYVCMSLQFETPRGVACLFTPEGWQTFLWDDTAPYSVSVVRLAFVEEAFMTQAFSIEPWKDEMESVNVQKIEVSSGPRRQVRCQSAELMAPKGIEPWLLANCAGNPNQAVKIWERIATEMIIRSLPNELYVDEQKQRHIILYGQLQHRLDYGNFNTNIAFNDLQETAKWVYKEGHDIEVRHTFLTSELARGWSPTTSFCDGLVKRLSDAIGAARLLYKAHLRADSKDTINALDKLRKTLSEDVERLLKHSHDLSSIVWRDITVIIGVVAVRFILIDTTESVDKTSEFGWIYLIVAIYIFVSYTISDKTNKNFLDILENSRLVWREKSFAYLDDKDYKILAEEPLKKAKNAYKKTSLWIQYVVWTLIIILIVGAAFEFNWLTLIRDEIISVI